MWFGLLWCKGFVEGLLLGLVYTLLKERRNPFISHLRLQQLLCFLHFCEWMMSVTVRMTFSASPLLLSSCFRYPFLYALSIMIFLFKHLSLALLLTITKSFYVTFDWFLIKLMLLCLCILNVLCTEQMHLLVNCFCVILFWDGINVTRNKLDHIIWMLALCS